MIKLMRVKMPLHYSQKQLYQTVAKRLQIPVADVLHVTYYKKSIDARKKPNIYIILTVLVTVKHEAKILKQFANDPDISMYTPYTYTIPPCAPTGKQPVIIGFGPAGMFAGLLLAKAGLQPLILERGPCVEKRQEDVKHFRQTGQLNPESNVQFGEGGAGTFSDGKLTTGIKDARTRFVLETFVEHGAPEEILYLAKPHIGTDRLIEVVRNMRQDILQHGGEIKFQAKFTNFLQQNGQLTGIEYEQDHILHHVETDQCILAIGHSARDVFTTLYQTNVKLSQKNFAVGVRIEHPQAIINQSMYGTSASKDLPPADYKLVAHLPNGHSLYTFCMCPGGEVIAAASESNRLVVNGMSHYARDGRNANSALLVGISSTDLHSEHPLAGMEFQMKIEEAAFQAGGSNYNAPVCCVGDFLAHRTPKSIYSVEPTYQPGITLATPDLYLPEKITETLRLGITAMAQKIANFDLPDAILTGVESRSSSPVRIERNPSSYESMSIRGVYPCGEGAGYAGGIMSAAVDGMHCAEHIIEKMQKRNI